MYQHAHIVDGVSMPTLATSALVYVLPVLFATGSAFAISANPVDPLIVGG